jgi:cytochrome c-type biogenesis protein CcmH
MRWARPRGLPAALVALALLIATPAAQALSPDEVLPDPVLETRARDIFGELRCVVCQSESIGESNADIARDLRMFVRERIAAGDDDTEVVAAVVERYGEFVLFRPPMTAANAPLWLAGPICLVFGMALLAAVLRRRDREGRRPRQTLTTEEKSRLDALMRDQGSV